jgi:hypothetical protein
MSSADLESKYRKTQNPKKRRAIAKVLFNRWRHSSRLIGNASCDGWTGLAPINFGMEIGKH